MGKLLKRIGDWIETVEIDAYARGGAVIRGQYMMLDMGATDAATTNIKVGDPNSRFSNVVTPTTAGLAAGYPVYVANEAIADDAWGTFTALGVVDGAVADDDASTGGVDAGDGLECNNGARFADAAGTASRLVGIALQDAFADSTASTDPVDASSSRRKVLHYGGMLGHGWNTAA